MSTVVVGSPPPELEALAQRRRRTGADRRDEVWEGVLHMTPAAHGRHADLQAQVLYILRPHAEAAGLTVLDEFNLGEPDEDYRVPDGGLHRPGAHQLYYPTAALAVEIVSPGDESWAKLAFYAARGVEEILIVDSPPGTVAWLSLTEGEFRPVQRSGLIELGPAALTEQIDWP
ncbi:MAG: Uma2 family endonuclease [Solirubrobacteraceae bacterium]